VQRIGSLAVALGVALAFVAVSGAARGPERGPKEKGVVAGELIVVFRAGVSEEERGKALEKADLKAEKTLTRDGRVKLAKGEPGKSERALKDLGSDPRVAYAEPNFRVHALQTPTDPSFGQLYGLVNTGQTVDGAQGTADADIDADLAWDVATGSSSAVVGIIDTGVDFSHPDLSGRSWVNPGEDCTGCRTNGVDDDGNGYVDDWRGWDFVNNDNDPFDDHGHGTHVAGTIGAKANNGVGVAGVNWDVRIAGLKFLDEFGGGTLADAIRAIDYATQNGIRITNNSWGGGGFSQALLDSIEQAGAAGGLFVAAAGNDGGDNDAMPSYPASYESPAVLSVAATDSKDALASFSNYGKVSVDLGAPGVSIYSTLPGNTYDWWSGTSMATPHVAGAAALVKAAFPGATSMGTKALLLRTVDAKSSLQQTTTGGRLNVGAAVTCSASPKVWIDEPLAGFDAIAGEPVEVVALAANCADPAGLTVAATANGAPLGLTSRGDGYYSASFVPATSGPLTIEVSGAVGSTVDTRSVTGSVAENYRITEEPFAWLDAKTGGTNTGLKTDDGTVTVTLPFSFTLYGQAFTSAKISTNGYLVFGGSSGTQWSNGELPATAEPNGIVAPYWDDLRLSTRGEIWYRTVGTAPNRRFVVSWIGAPHYYDIGDSTFQVVLDEGSGDVVFQYQDVVFGDEFNDYGVSATIGLESVDGTQARLFSFDERSLVGYENAKAIRFSFGAPAVPDTTPPAAPAGLTATAGEHSVTLDWADVGDASTYGVYRDGNRVATTGSSAYTDTGLAAGTIYTYRVTAVDASGNESAPSNEASAVPTADTTPPATPSGLAAVAGNAQVVLDWADNGEPDFGSYRVYRDGTQVASVTASGYTDTAVTNGVTYRYAISAVDKVGNESLRSAEVAAMPVAPRTKAYQPALYTITRGSLYAGSISSLAANDGNRLEISARKRSGWHWAEFYASATIAASEQATLGKLTVDYDGNATSSNAWIDLWVYDWAFGDWEWVSGDYASTSDRSFSWTTTDPARYVSSGGEIRFMVTGDQKWAFRTRTDQIRFTIEY